MKRSKDYKMKIPRPQIVSEFEENKSCQKNQKNQKKNLFICENKI